MFTLVTVIYGVPVQLSISSHGPPWMPDVNVPYGVCYDSNIRLVNSFDFDLFSDCPNRTEDLIEEASTEYYFEIDNIAVKVRFKILDHGGFLKIMQKWLKQSSLSFITLLTVGYE